MSHRPSLKKAFHILIFKSYAASGEIFKFKITYLYPSAIISQPPTKYRVDPLQAATRTFKTILNLNYFISKGIYTHNVELQTHTAQSSLYLESKCHQRRDLHTERPYFWRPNSEHYTALNSKHTNSDELTHSAELRTLKHRPECEPEPS